MADFAGFQQRVWDASGKVMCMMCFGSFALDELNVNDDGDLEDICKRCGAEEKFTILFRLMRPDLYPWR